MTTSNRETPVKLLALDGGGIRALSQLLIIKEIMHKVMLEDNMKRKQNGQALLLSLPKPCDHFDLIGGTGTGGIVALMLGRLRMDVDTAIKYYDILAKEVFSQPKRLQGDGKFKATKLEAAIKSVVKDVTGDPESPLLERNESTLCRAFVCAKNAHNMDANIPTLFRTYESHETHLDCKIWEAARATSAAPTFFKRIEIGRAQPFVDGGIGGNNPSRVILDEANTIFGDRHIGCLVSVGTGQVATISIEKSGFFQQIVPTDLIDALKAIATDCESTHESMLRLFAQLPTTYFRLNVEQGMQGIKFSEWERLSSVEAHTRQYLRKKEVEDKLVLLGMVMRAPKAQLTIKQFSMKESLYKPDLRLIIDPASPGPPPGSVQKEHKLCPPPVASFKGRKDILDKMCRYFDSDSESQRIFVLYGLGGAGKSQLAFKFIEESKSKRFSQIFYIDATNEKTLQTDLEAITPGNTDPSVETSLRWLESQRDGSWLLFFDNADNVELKLKTFFPECAYGNILITTRNRELRHYAGKDADANIKGLDPEDAKNLLLYQARAEKSNENMALADGIVQVLHYFALAVAQAGAFIHCHSSLSEYRELYRRERDNLLQNEETQEQDPYELAVYSTWKLSYDKLDVSAKSLLQICSFLHHEGISEKMFEKAALSQLQLEDSDLEDEVTQLLNQLGKRGSSWSSWNFRKVTMRLGSYSLMEYDHQNRTYSIHPLVQHWSGTTMEGNKLIRPRVILAIIGLSISWTFADEDYKYRRTLLKHATNSMVSFKLDDINPLIGTHIALVYSEQGHWRDAEAIETVVVEKRKRTLGENHPDTLTSMDHVANLYLRAGRWKDAEELHAVVMEKRKQVLGDDHPDTLTSMDNIATTYHHQGRWPEAEAFEVEVVKKRKQVLGDEHPDTLTSMANLSNIYRDQGRWAEAEDLGAVVVKGRKRVLGDDHINTLHSMAILAMTYSKQGRLKDAQVLKEEATEKLRKVLGDDHPDTLSSIGNLANTYRVQGRWKDAEALGVEVMEAKKRVLGDKHPATITSMGVLAAIYSDQGRWTEAEVLEVSVMEMRKQVLGDDHPNTLISMANLADTYRSQGRLNDAEVLEVVVMEKKKRLLGDDHPDTLESMGNLAATYRSLGRLKDAEELQLGVLEKKTRLLGDSHHLTLNTMAELAKTYMEQSRWKDAGALQVVVVEKRKQELGEDHPSTLHGMIALMVTYTEQGRFDDAEALQVEVVERRKRLLGEHHVDTIGATMLLANIYGDQGRWKDAETLHMEVLEKCKRELRENHSIALKSRAGLAAAYRNQGRLNDAEELEAMAMAMEK